MRPDIQQELASIAGDLNELSAVLSQAQQALVAESEGADARGAVSVRLDAAGRVVAFRPSAQWRNRISPQELGDAVLEAVQVAATERFGRWAEAMEGGQAAPATAPPQPRVAVASGPAVDLHDLVDEVLTGFEAIAGVGTPGAPVPPGTPTDAGQAGGVVGGTARVRIALSATGIPTSVGADPGWVAGTSLTRLAEEVLAAFTAAYQGLDEAGAAATAAPPMSAAMAAVAADPAGMLLRYAQSLGVPMPDDTDGPQLRRW